MKRHRRKTVPTIETEISPKNRDCLRGLDGKYGKFRIVQNKNRTETDPEDDDDDDDDEDEEQEIPEEAGLFTIRQRETEGTRTQNLILDGQIEMLINRIGTVVPHIKETFVCD